MLEVVVVVVVIVLFLSHKQRTNRQKKTCIDLPN